MIYKQFYIRLESLRGLAALWVVLFHIPPWYRPVYDINLIRNGYLFVDFFFVLSGFVIFLNYIGRLNHPRRLCHFMCLRFIRLYPVHLFFLLCFLAIECKKHFLFWSGHWHGGGGNKPFEKNNSIALINQFFLMHSLGLTNGTALTFNSPSWSISTEFYTYLIFGVIVLVGSPARVFPYCIATCLLALSLFYAMPIHFDEFHRFVRCIFGFFLGCSLHGLAALQRWLRWVGYFSVLGISVILIIKINVQLAEILMSLLSSGLILAVASKHRPLTGFAWLEARLLRRLGTISYSLYMSHYLSIWMINRLLRVTFQAPLEGSVCCALSPWVGLITYAACVVFVILIAEVSYRFIERPSLILMAQAKAHFVKIENNEWKHQPCSF